MEEQSIIDRLLLGVPEELREEFGRALTTVHSSESVAEFTLAADASASLAEKALEAVFPEDVFDEKILPGALSYAYSPVLDFAGADRLLWVAARSGKGTRSDPSALSSYLAQATDWLKFTLLRNMASEIGHGVLGVEIIPKQETVRRMLTDTVQYQWVSRLIFDAAASVTIYPSIAFVNSKSVAEIFDYIKSSVSQFRTVDEHRKAWKSLNQDTKKLAEAFCVKNPDKFKVRDLLVSTEAERYPFIWMDDVAVPGVKLVSNLSTETALYAVVREHIGQEFGRWFELVARKALGDVSPSAQNISEPIAIAIPGTQDPGQVDFALLDSDGTALVGEVKGFAVTEQIASVQNSLSSLTKATSQLAVRLDALKLGSKLRGGGADHKVRTAFGLGVTLHSYAGALWRSDALLELGPVRDDFALIPLTQAIMVLAAMDNLEELRMYLLARQTLLQRRTIAFDEIDLLIACTSKNFAARVGRYSQEIVVMVPMVYVSRDNSLVARPTAWGNPWLQTLRSHVQPISPRHD